jgi:hypothetical protein
MNDHKIKFLQLVEKIKEISKESNSKKTQNKILFTPKS